MPHRTSRSSTQNRNFACSGRTAQYPPQRHRRATVKYTCRRTMMRVAVWRDSARFARLGFVVWRRDLVFGRISVIFYVCKKYISKIFPFSKIFYISVFKKYVLCFQFIFHFNNLFFNSQHLIPRHRQIPSARNALQLFSGTVRDEYNYIMLKPDPIAVLVHTPAPRSRMSGAGVSRRMID